MFLSNLHAHTFYSDGESHAEEYIKKAIEKGFISVGISDHSPVIVQPEHQTWVFDHHLQPDTYDPYIAELEMLREKYKDDIEVYIGIEEDYYPVTKRSGVDFTIGAVHFLQSPTTGEYHMPDYTREEFEAASVSFGGVEEFVGAYFARMKWIVSEHPPDILAHIDLLNKLNDNNRFFNSSDGWYRRLVGEVLDIVEDSSIIVELNSGAIGRGYDVLYPEDFIMAELFSRGIPITLSSDAHHVDNLDCGFAQMTALAKDHGYKTVKRMEGGAFREVSI